MSGAERIAAERRRQVAVEGWTPEHDDEHLNGELANAAAFYALTDAFSRSCHCECIGSLWPFDGPPKDHGADQRIRELEKAGALIAAEIDRLLRAVGGDA